MTNFGILAADSYKLKLPLKVSFIEMAVLFPLSHECENFSGDFIACTGRARIYIKYQVTEKRGYSFENALIEKSKSSTRKKGCLVERKHYIINLNVYLHGFLSFQ